MTDTPAERIAARLDRIPDSDALLVEKTELRELLAEHARMARRLEVVDLVLPVLGATVANTDLVNARDAVACILLAIDRAAPSGGPPTPTQADTESDLRAARDMLRRHDGQETRP